MASMACSTSSCRTRRRLRVRGHSLVLAYVVRARLRPPLHTPARKGCQVNGVNKQEATTATATATAIAIAREAGQRDGPHYR